MRKLSVLLCIIVLSAIYSNALANNSVVRLWGTYFGGTSNEFQNSSVIDYQGNIIIAGTTESNDLKMTPDAYQSALDSLQDAYIAKFNPVSHDLIWSTYYGEKGNDSCTAVATDLDGNIYIVGTTNSLHNIATNDSYQNRLSGLSDGFLIKFNKHGQRLWGTYFGGNDNDGITSISIDKAGSILIAGWTTSTDYIASDDAQQSDLSGGVDAFIAKFTADGNIIWSTYYGGATGDDYAEGIISDNENNVVVTGRTTSSDGTFIVTENAHQLTYGGDALPGNIGDAFLVKFNPIGKKIWGTYYGGNNADAGVSVCVDYNNNIYLSGITLSTADSIISTSDAYQTNNAGSIDAFLVKFSPNGQRIWGTYYGGNQNDMANDVYCSSFGNIYLSGSTNSQSGIATTNVHKSTYGGGSGQSFGDGFFVKFDSSGQRIWASYYGGEGEDKVSNIMIGEDRQIYISGMTNSSSFTNEFASEYAMQDTLAGGFDSFVAILFDTLDIPTPTEPATGSKFYVGNIPLEWTPIDKSTGYLLEISTNEQFTELIDSVYVQDTTFTSQNLTPGNRYYWRVKAMNSFLESDWSDIMKFDFEATLPIPLITSPNDGQEFTDEDITLVWQFVHSSASYTVEIAMDSLFTNILDSITTDVTQFTIPSIAPAFKYFWRVKAVNDYIESSWSKTRSFIKILVLAIPSPIKPENNSIIDRNYIQFLWNSSTNATEYNFVLSKDSTFEDFANSTELSDTTITIEQLDYNTKYYWKVIAIGNYAESEWTGIQSFTTLPAIPDKKLVLLYPEDNAKDVEIPLTLRWNGDENIDYYHLALSDADGKIILEDSTITLESGFIISYPVDILDSGMTYYWHVRGRNIAGEGPWSDTWNFTTTPVTSVDDNINPELVKIAPNPFTDEVKIYINLKAETHIQASIYNFLGMKIANLYDGLWSNQGNYLKWNSTNHSRGTYFLRLKIDNKMMILKMIHI